MSSLDNSFRDIQRLVWSGFIAAFLAVSALFPIPIGPVPITLQTMFALLAGLLLGPRYGVFSVCLYIAAGCLGLPVFAGGRSGIATFWGLTGGYLATFIALAYIASFCYRTKKFSFILCLIICLAATLVNLFCGALWLGWLQDYSFTQAISFGILPFLPGGVVKALAAVAIYAHMRKHGLLPK